MTERLFFVVSSAAESLSEHISRTSMGSGSKSSSRNGTPNSLLPGSASQLSTELQSRLLTASQRFPAFTPHQKMAIQRASERKPRFGEPIPLTVEPKPAKHLRRSSIDRILEELETGSKRTGKVDKIFKQAFDQIMLSSPNGDDEQ